MRELFAKFQPETSRLYTAISQYIATRSTTAPLELLNEVDEELQHPETLFAAVHYLVLKNRGEDLTRIYEAPEDRNSLDAAGPAFVEFCNNNDEELLWLI